MFYIYTLGCKETNKENADIFIINTCFVTNVAQNKSFKIIRQAQRINPKALIIVCGCLSQMKADEVLKMGVHIVIGNKDKSKIVDYIKNYQKRVKKIYDLENTTFEDMRLNNFNKGSSVFKII